jgi:hypothetical protein
MEVKDKQGRNVTKQFILGIVFVILILGIPTILWNIQLNQQKAESEERAKLYQKSYDTITLVIESKTRWNGVVYLIGPYGYEGKAIEGSGNATYNYTVDDFALEIAVHPSYVGLLDVRLYVNGTFLDGDRVYYGEKLKYSYGSDVWNNIHG